MSVQDEMILFEKIKKGDEKAFESLFHTYYGHLCVFASNILSDDITAEEIVQDFFVKLWEKRRQITIDSSLKNYLFRSVKNLCLNAIQHNKIKRNYAEKTLSESANTLSEDRFVDFYLMEKIEKSIGSLPEKRKKIFRLSREDGLKYQEIAKKLNISIKTVETQMSLALKTLREKLKNYDTFFTFFLWFNKK